MGVDLVQRVVDVDRLVADDVELDVARQLRLDAWHHVLDAIDDGHRVRAGLPPHLHDHGRLAVEPGQATLLLGAVLDPTDIADPQRHAAAVGDHDVGEVGRRLDAAHRPQHALLDVGRDVAARQVGVLAHERVAHRADGDAVGREAVGIEPHADRALLATDDEHLADARTAFELDLRDLVGQLGQFAHRTVARQRDGHDRRRVVVELGDDRRTGVARQPVQHRGDAVAHVLGRDVDVAVQVERDQHERDALPGDAAQLRDALDGVDDLLEPLADQHLDLFGRGAGQHRLDPHRRQVHRREPVHARARGTRPRRPRPATARSCWRRPDGGCRCQPVCAWESDGLRHSAFGLRSLAFLRFDLVFTSAFGVRAFGVRQGVTRTLPRPRGCRVRR